MGIKSQNKYVTIIIFIYLPIIHNRYVEYSSVQKNWKVKQNTMNAFKKSATMPINQNGTLFGFIKLN